MIPKMLRKFPVTITISLLTLVIGVAPQFAELMQLDFNAVADGQWWRIWTGHLAHFDREHLLWDLVMFIGIAGMCEKTYPAQILPALLLIGGTISCAVGAFVPQVDTYRGLSGIDTALFVWIAGARLLESLKHNNTIVACCWGVPCAGLIFKLVFEATTHQTMFVEAQTFTPLVESHLAGVAVGIVICIYVWCAKMVSSRSCLE